MDQLLALFEASQGQQTRQIAQGSEPLSQDGVGVDRLVGRRLQRAEAHLEASFLGGQVAELGVDEALCFRGQPFEERRGLPVDVGQASLDRVDLLPGIHALGGNLFLDALAQQRLALAGQEGVEPATDRIDQDLLDRLLADQVLLARGLALHHVAAAGVVEGLDPRAILPPLRRVHRPALVVLAAPPAGQEAAEQVRRAEPAAGAEGPLPDLREALLGQLLGAVVEGGRNERLVGAGHDDPVACVVLAALVGFGPRACRGRPALDPVELRERSPVPNRVATEGWVADDLPDRAHAPLRFRVRGPVAVARRRDAVSVQSVGDRATAHAAVDVVTEDPPDDGDALGAGGDELGDVALARVEPLAAGEDPDEASLDVVDLLVAGREPAHPLVGSTSRVVVEEVVAERRRSAAPGALGTVAELSADRDDGQVLDELLRHPLLDADHEVVRIATGEVLVDVDDLDPGLPELEAKVAGLIEVATGEA